MEIVIRKKQESKWNTEHWKLDIDWKMLLSCGKRTSYKKCPTILSKEFKKSFNYLVKFSFKKEYILFKVGAFKYKTIRIQGLHVLGLHQAFMLNSLGGWHLFLRLQPLIIVCNSNNIRRTNVCYLLLLLLLLF